VQRGPVSREGKFGKHTSIARVHAPLKIVCVSIQIVLTLMSVVFVNYAKFEPI